MIKRRLLKYKNKLILFLVGLLVIVSTMCFSSNIDRLILKTLNHGNNVISNNKLIVHFIDVGQGDAIAINFPNGEIGIVDTGLVYSSNYFIKYLKNYVLPQANDNVIDYLFYTHADADHTGGIKSLLFNFEVKNIFRQRQYAYFESLEDINDVYFDDTAGEYAKTMTSIYEEVNNGANLVKIENEMCLDIGESKIKIFYPIINSKSSNNFSYYIKLEYKDSSFLFTGDTDSAYEKEIVKSYGDELDCDVLKVAHHGSDTSTSLEFVNCVSPNYAVICVGENNYGHPTSAVINNLKGGGVGSILRTDLNGNILFVVENDISVISGVFYISKIEFKYVQLAWCLTFFIVCWLAYFVVFKIMFNIQSTN